MNNPNDVLPTDQLDDLATGQLGLIAAWRLRRQIRRNPDLAREWVAVRGLHNDLRMFSAANAKRLSPVTHASTYTVGGLTLKRRTAAFAAGALVLLSVTGALAARHWETPEADCGMPGVDRDHDWWWFHGQFRGNATLLKPDGTKISSVRVEGNSASGTLKFVYTNSSSARNVAAATLEGMGKHPIHDGKGKLLDYIVMSPLSSKDKQEISDSDTLDARTFAEYYRQSDRATPSGEGRHLTSIVPMTDMVGDCIDEDVSGHGLTSGHNLPVSWKSYGDVHVRSKYLAPAETVPVLSASNLSTGKSKEHWTVRLPQRTIIDESESEPYPPSKELSAMSPEDRIDFLTRFPAPHTVPETYWTLAEPGTSINDDTGKWEHVRQSGKFFGYGHFLVRDLSGRPALILDISRPKRKRYLTTENYSDIEIAQKVVPGWDGEE